MNTTAAGRTSSTPGPKQGARAAPAPAPEKGPPSTVCFVPLYDTPYQRELARHLAQQGFQVASQHGLKRLLDVVLTRREKPRIVHVHWLPLFQLRPVAALRYLMFFVRLAVLRVLGSRIVWTVHNLQHHEASFPRIEHLFTSFVIALASRAIVHSPTAAKLVAGEFGSRVRSKLAVVPHGHFIDVYPNTLSRAEARERLGIAEDAMVFLFLGYIRPYKGVNELIRAFRQLSSPNALLVIAGKPFDANSVDELRAISDGDPRIRLHPGYVPDDDIQVYMNAANAVVFPYQDILTSGAVLLAMSFGRACIAPVIGCIPDVLDGEGAFLYPPATPGALAHALRQACVASERLVDMGTHNARKSVQWGWGGIAEKTARIYAEVLRPPETAPGDLPSG